MGPYAAMYRAMTLAEGKAPVFNASMDSKIRRAVAYLDEGRSFFWERGGFITGITSETAENFELSWRERTTEDKWSDIDKRLAEAYYETQTFADYIGAPWQYEEEA